jgi:hypothetical protein
MPISRGDKIICSDYDEGSGGDIDETEDRKLPHEFFKIMPNLFEGFNASKDEN